MGRIGLDHTIVASRNARAAAQRLAAVLGVPWAERSAFGPFCLVYVNDGLTLDFDQHDDGAFAVQHFCFRVGNDEFDALLARLRAHAVAIRSTPHGAVDGQVNTLHGGRIVYWSEPDGHVWEALTRS